MTEEQKKAPAFVSLVTGANRGIGLEWCKQLLKENYSVIATCRNPSNAKELIKLQQSNKDKLSIEKLDVTSDDQIQTLQKKLKDKPIDLVILNAGVLNKKKFGELTRKDLLDTLNVNVCGSLLVVQALYNNVKISTRKQIIGISSGGGSIGDMDVFKDTPYRISKSGFNMGVANIALKSKVDSDNVHAIIMCPGFVKTDMTGGNGLYTTEVSVGNAIKNLVKPYKKLKNGGFYSHKGNEMKW